MNSSCTADESHVMKSGQVEAGDCSDIGHHKCIVMPGTCDTQEGIAEGA